MFVPGGDQDPPAGDYPGPRPARGPRRIGRPFPHVGITGYPESHPTISDDLTVQSMWDKRRHATHVVSNLTFDPDASARGSTGCAPAASPCRCCSACPGPIDRTKLLTMATKIGVGESTRFLKKHKGTLARLATPGGFTGEKFLERCARRWRARARW